MKPLFDQGLDFLKLDRNPDVPFGKACFESIQKYGKETKGRGFILQHVGSLSNPDHKKYPTKWSGDSEIFWDLPNFPDASHSTMGGYKQNVEMVAWPKRMQYEVPFLTHDGGGFRVIGSTDFGEELFIRWIQFSLFNTVTEVFQSLFNSHSNLAWEFSSRADSMYRDLSFKTSLISIHLFVCTFNKTNWRENAAGRWHP
jgi:alpha-glucosidase (family GH31 glycosyl hydrolase)